MPVCCFRDGEDQKTRGRSWQRVLWLAACLLSTQACAETQDALGLAQTDGAAIDAAEPTAGGSEGADATGPDAAARPDASRTQVANPSMRDAQVIEPPADAESPALDAGSLGQPDAEVDAGPEPDPLPPCDPRPLGSDVYVGDVTVLTQSDVEALDGFTRIGGSLWIGDLGTSTDITDLLPLACLTEVTSYLVIMNNNDLTSLRGLDRLATVGDSVDIVSNPLIEDLAGLRGLSSVGTRLAIGSNGLLSLRGLEGITVLPDSLNVTQNMRLTSLAGLDNLETIGGSADIHENPLLTDVSALGSLRAVYRITFRALPSVESLSGVGLQEVEDDCNIDFMDGLQDVGLDQLVRVGNDLVIANSPVLTGLGLPALELVVGELTVAQNPSLPQCEATGLRDQVGKATCGCSGNAACP